MTRRFEAVGGLQVEVVEGRFMVRVGGGLVPAEITDEYQPGTDGILIETDPWGDDTIIMAIICAGME